MASSDDVDAAEEASRLVEDVAEASAPPVVLVMVVRDAGPWFEDALSSVAGQDYPNLSVLVIDAGRTEAQSAEGPDTVARVAAVLPSAYVRRLAGSPGYGPAANDVLHVVEGAAFYLFCHDDVALEPGAVRALVEEAYRSNAGVVGPKLVMWDHPERLLQVGMTADKSGALSPMVEPGELDQEQHDAVRDVFVVPGACMLVRADLFAALGGFDPGISFGGEDLDLCWRAQVAGARVVVVPAATVRHRQARLERPGDLENRGELLLRHRVRTVLTSYGRFHLLRVLPQVLALSLVETVYAFVTGRRGQARAQVAAWRWNLARLGEIRERRRQMRAVRLFPDAEVRRLQVRGSARVRAYVRGELHAGERLRTSVAGLSRELGDPATGDRRLVVGAWLVVAVVLAVGTRDLLLRRIPAVGGLAPFDAGPAALLRAYASGWRHAGLGAEAPAPTAFALLGLAGIPLLGGMGLLQQLLVVGALPAGIAGAWRLTDGLASRRARVAGMLVYAVVPLPYDALSRGSWGGLLFYAAAPWVLARLLRATGGTSAAHAGTARPLWQQIAGLGLLLALLAAFVPIVILVVPLLALAIWVGGLLTGDGHRSWRAVQLALGASLVAAVVHLPWTFDFFLPGSEWNAVGGVSPLVTDPLGVGALLRFQTGGAGVSSLGWAVPFAAALPLLIGREWRFGWAVRCWCVAIGCWALAWAGGHGELGVALPPADVLLAPAAAALALAVALGLASFEEDLRGYRFGWRQLAPLFAGAAIALASLPIVVAAVDGRWDLANGDHAASLSFLSSGALQREGSFRVLWVGQPETLPVAPFRLTDDVGYGLSTDGPGGLLDRWAAPAYGATSLVADSVRLAAAGETARLGRLLAPMGIRYVVLTNRAAPARTGGDRHPLPRSLVDAVDRQLDLRQVSVDPALALYENVAWAPVRASVTGTAADRLDASSASRVSATLDLHDVTAPVLGRLAGHAGYRGEVPAGTVYVAEGNSSRWHLRVDGQVAERRTALGWANVFDVERGGAASLSYRTSPLRRLAIVLQVVLWALLVLVVVLGRRSWRRATPTEER